MSIKKQKIICFIPIINFVIIGFLWLRMYYKYPIHKTRFLKRILQMCVFVVIITIPNIILNSLFDNKTIEILINLISSYLYLVAFSCIAVKDQEQYLTENVDK